MRAWLEREAGLRLAYQVWGREDGVPVLCLHGFTGSGTTWRGVWDPSWPARCWAPDLWGHGASTVPADPARLSLEATAADLAALLDAGGLARVLVAGYSMGGRVALEFACRYPERVAGLLLESASPGIADPAERARRAAADDALADRIEREGMDWFTAFWEALPLFASHRRLPPEVQAALHRLRRSQSPAGLAQSLRGAGTGRQSSWWDALPTIQVPVVLVTGSLDPKFTAIARAMAARLPHVRHWQCAGAGHTPHLERPDCFRAALAALLAATRV
ncbi:Putative 2-succinyl-6-hydroxy-2,4-cyclohexadiene-1-carboxylate synthase [Candidatus Hydrogenisulfobacillus filiaventi]|uniref:Putative 2-succinyl-6-hydroxy-2,4-cyclohexadiene-1-carboxylate synthase n=1 Tax=Candidatus Hydrogenisulfobacillus filiaventi TaxID=2707344 RepID=A0A6F8ZF12_9FIRM|nr:Putative 2-succinyl-6-hydroxy-2,4-cyclohexadiene-1-carboxylate synthase [Candidatus Hydrogenisulfobacillus filiaventi]